MSRIIRPWSNRIRPSSPGGRRGGGGGGVTLTKSVDFDGLTQYADGTISLAFPGLFTMAVWFKADTVVGQREIFEVKSTDNQEGIRLRMNGTSFQEFLWTAGSLRSNETRTSLSAGQWYLGAVTRNASNLIQAHIATPGGALSSSTGDTYAVLVDTFTTITLGDEQSGFVSGSPFSGRIARAGFWTSDELASGLLAAVALDPQAAWAGALHEYRCGDGDTLPTLTDSGSVGGWDLTAVNSPTIETDYPVAP